MDNFRNRPNGKYIFNANWEELYVLTKHWKTDLLFYKDDLIFLDELIDNYLLWISKEENLEAAKNTGKSMAEITEKCEVLLERVQQHLRHLSNLIINPFAYNSQKFREEHQQLEDDFTEFIKTFRVVKKAVFKLTKHLVESNEFIRLLAKSSL